MKLETLVTLLRQENPTANAWNNGKKIQVVFAENSKVYSYSGSVYKVAEKLNLIPVVEDYQSEANQIISEVLSGKEVVGLWELASTVRYLSNGKVNYYTRNDNEIDEFDRPTAVYKLAD